MATGSFVNATVTTENTALADAPAPFLVSIAEGGTGATTAAQARTNLGLGAVATDNIITIAKGGTSATTAEQARANLGAKGEYYDSGDSINFGTGDGTILAGLSVSATSMIVDVLLPRKFTEDDTVTSTVSCAWIRGLGGQISGPLSVSCELRGSQTLRLVITTSGLTDRNVHAANIVGAVTFD